MSFSRIAISGLVAAGCFGVALACGPLFPGQILDYRDGISSSVLLSFPFEASRLVTPPPDGLRAVESYDATAPWQGNLSEEPEAGLVERQEARSEAWRAILTGPADPDILVSKVAAARQAADGGAVLLAGAGLPPAVLNYIAGAVEFRADRLAAAMGYFEMSDRLPAEQRQVRAVAAAYMQGRVQQRLGSMASARAAFQAARRHAEAGAPDPMGLAVASLGEEARTLLAESGLVKVPWPLPASNADDSAAAHLIAHAIRLYAEQAARGSKMGLLSLREVAALLVAHEHVLTVAAADPLVRRLLVAYALARSGDAMWDVDRTDDDIERLIDALAARAAPVVGDDLDRLAALAYQGARYEAAARLVSGTTRPLGLRVRAKLALQRGDREAAVRDWTAAFRSAEQAGAAALDEGSKTWLRTDLAIIRVSQGEYSESLRLLFPVAADYWGDVSYIAERVLTVDELKAFVDSLPASSGQRKPESMDGYVFDSRDFMPADRLRLVLARRLVRAGRLQEAVAHFPPAVPQTPPDERNATADEARDYLATIEAARPGMAVRLAVAEGCPRRSPVQGRNT